MQIDEQKRRRISPTIEFTDTREGVGNYAKGWFFWVPSAFKGSLDISASEYIDATKTPIIRDRMSEKLFGISHEELKRRIKESGRNLADDADHMHIQSYAVRDIRETEGSPPLYSFREGDLLESRCGAWHVQVKTAIADSLGEEGKIGFWLLPGGAPWQRDKLLETSPVEFVALLRTGSCAVVELTS
jgi:hypothetical protein